MLPLQVVESHVAAMLAKHSVHKIEQHNVKSNLIFIISAVEVYINLEAIAQ